PARSVFLGRSIPRHPFVPQDRARRDERCSEVSNIQVSALVQRIRAAGSRNVVLGVSGGLDSTQALLVAVRAMDRLGWPRPRILGYALPGFASGKRTLRNAKRLMDSLGVSREVIDIRPSSRRMLKDIGHPFAKGRRVFDVTFENVQAGERT